MANPISILNRILLFGVHLFILTAYYIRFIYDKCVKVTLGEKKISENTFLRFKKIPSHLAFVFNSKNPKKYTKNIQEILDLVQNIKGINEITLFFTSQPPELTYERERVNIFTEADIKPNFLKEMQTKLPFNSIPDPFKSNIDFVIFYSKLHSMCNFFPWKLDVTIFSYPGKINICSKYTVYKSFLEYQNTEQRLGK